MMWRFVISIVLLMILVDTRTCAGEVNVKEVNGSVTSAIGRGKRGAFHNYGSGLPIDYASTYGYNVPLNPYSALRYSNGLRVPPLFGANVPYVLRSGNAAVTSFNVNYPQVAYNHHKVLPATLPGGFPLPIAANPVAPVSYLPQGNFVSPTNFITSVVQPTNILPPAGVLPPTSVLPTAPVVQPVQTIVKPVVAPSNVLIPHRPIALPNPVLPVLPAQRPQVSTVHFNFPVSSLQPGFIQAIQPVQPGQPIQPEQPNHPGHGIQPAQPVQPLQPSHPLQPAHPLQPTQPFQPVQPTPATGNGELGPSISPSFPNPTGQPPANSNQPWRPILISPPQGVNPEVQRPPITLLPPYRGETEPEPHSTGVHFGNGPQFPQNDVRHILEAGESNGNRHFFEQSPSSYDVPLHGNKGYHY